MKEMQYRFFDSGGLKIVKEEEERTLSFTISDDTNDRYREIMNAKGCDLTNYLKNPVVLWCHNHSIPVIGRGYGTKVKEKSIFSKVEFCPNEFSIGIYELYKRGFMKGVSIGFLPKPDGTEELNPKDNVGAIRKHNEWELLEYSMVPVGANPNALMTATKELSLPPILVKSIEDWSKQQEGFCKKYFETALPIDACKECGEIKVYDMQGNEPVVQDNPVIVGDLKLENGEIAPLLTDEEVKLLLEEKPYENEHSCRLEDPKQFDKFTRKNCEQKHDGKCIDVIYGIKANKSKIQALRYNKEVWTEAGAKSHCKTREGKFEAAKKEIVIDAQNEAEIILTAEEFRTLIGDMKQIKIVNATPDTIVKIVTNLSKEAKIRLVDLLKEDASDIDIEAIINEDKVEVDLDSIQIPETGLENSGKEITISDEEIEMMIDKSSKLIGDILAGEFRKKLGIVD